jgi:phage gp29-like protein
VFHGYSVHEVIWQRQDRFLVPGRVIDRPQRRFQFDHDNRLRLVTRSNMVPGEELGDHKWLLTRHMPSHDNPYGVAVFSACFWPWAFKHSGYRFFTKFVERYGIPTPIGKYPRGTPKDQVTELVNQLAQMIEDTVAAIPDDKSVELLSHKGGEHSVHGAFLNLCNRELSKALTSQTLATEVQDTGSRAVAEVGHEREQAGQESDREMVQATWQELCNWITELNYPGARPPVWEFYEESEVSQQAAETIGKIVAYAPLKRSEVYERLQFTPPQETDDVIFLGRSQAQPGQPSPGAGLFNAPCPSCGHVHLHGAGNDADPLDALADQADEEATAIFERLAQPIRDLMEQYIEEGKTLEDLRDAIPELYPDISDDELGALLVNYSLVAQLKGIDDA